MASKSARKRRKRRPPPPPNSQSGETAPSDDEGVAETAGVAPGLTPAGSAGRRRPGATPAGSATPGAPRRGEDERPPAPWGNFPLVELSVLTGLIMLILGFFFVSGDRAPILIAAGLALGSIGGLDQTIREHFSGYQSHTMILAGVPALIVLGALFYVGPDELPSLARGGIAIAVFAAAAYLLSRAFSRRSGGLRYRFRPLGGRGR